MKKRILLFSIVLAIVLAAVGFAAGQSLLVKTELQCRDKFPARLALYSPENKKVHIGNLSGDYKVFFYLRSDSTDSLGRLTAIRKIMDIYRWDSVRYYLLWEDKIPFDNVKASGIDTGCNYSLKNGETLSRYIPTAFLVGNDQTVEFVSGSAYTDILYKIYNLAGKNDLRPTINKMIFNDAHKSNQALDPAKPNLLIFTTSTCRECVSEADTIKTAMKTAGNTMNVITVRPDFDSRQDMDVSLCYDYSYAYFEVYKKMNGVEAMPFYVVTDQQYAVVKLFTKASQLTDYLKSHTYSD